MTESAGSVTELAGRDARHLARRLMAALPQRSSALSIRGIDLTTTAEHLLYVALRREAASRPVSSFTPLRGLARLGRATVGVRGRRLQPAQQGAIVVLVTQPIHIVLFEPVAERLRERGVSFVLVDAESRHGRAVRSAGISHRLASFVPLRAMPALTAHVVATARILGQAPTSWREVLGAAADRFARSLRNGLPIVALDAARVDELIRQLEPSVVTCFNELGTLARIVPAAAGHNAVSSIDLPHAEASDPWGSYGLQYDAVAVYGPRATATMRQAGFDPSRVVEIGPLRYDRLIAAPRQPARTAPRRVVFASQPSDPEKPAYPPDWKRAAIRAAVAVAERLQPSELVLVPHPTETDTMLDDELAHIEVPSAVTVRIERSRGLHDVLPGAWVLVTAWSQSIFDAVIAGVPSLSVTPEGESPRVTYVADGIAIGVRSPADAAMAAGRLSTAESRDAAARSAFQALGGRLGPLDGRAADRAADLLVAHAGAARQRRMR